MFQILNIILIQSIIYICCYYSFCIANSIGAELSNILIKVGEEGARALYEEDTAYILY